jgi:hypothetical protein
MVHAPAVGSITFARRVRSRGFLHFAGDLWREHGDVFEAHVGLRRLVFVMHPDAVEQVTVSGRQRYDKKDSYDVVRKYLIGQGLVGSTGDLWRRQRKLAPFFTPRGVATYADLVIRDSLRFAVRWEELAAEGREVDLSEEMMLITASIILKAMFSSETPESITQMKSAVETMITYIDTQMVPVRIPTWVPSRRNRRYFEARNLVHGSIAALIAERRAIHETDWPNDLLLSSLRSRPADLHRQQLLAAREPPAARDPRAMLPPAPARRLRIALRHARHAEHRGRPPCRDRDAVMRSFVTARRVWSLVGDRNETTGRRRGPGSRNLRTEKGVRWIH